MHLQVLRELEDIISCPLSSTLEWSMQSGDVCEDCKKTNVTSPQKGQKEDPRNYRADSLTWVLECLILEAISKNAEYKKLIRSSQHGFTKGKLCLTNLISLYSGITASRHEGRALDIVYLDFSKGFDAVSHILIGKLGEWGLDKWMVNWIENWSEWQVSKGLFWAFNCSIFFEIMWKWWKYFWFD